MKFKYGYELIVIAAFIGLAAISHDYFGLVMVPAVVVGLFVYCCINRVFWSVYSFVFSPLLNAQIDPWKRMREEKERLRSRPVRNSPTDV
jgi:hypothetical protein